ncbi:phage integrase SAM-like domain-containing protein, partial [Streptococcus pneumoniae]|uniref:phage integrase SAM-like domain-containing protein n=1 Tax=Streptococcus pneumoniae TaxID=1313 RepID=UPI0018B0E252
SRNYEKVIKKVKQYEKFSRKTLTLESLNENFANLYNDWLIRHHDYLPNSVGEHLKIIGTFLRWCEKDGKAINRNALE